MCYELRHKRIYYITYYGIFYKLANHEVLNIRISHFTRMALARSIVAAVEDVPLS